MYGTLFIFQEQSFLTNTKLSCISHFKRTTSGSTHQLSGKSFAPQARLCFSMKLSESILAATPLSTGLQCPLRSLSDQSADLWPGVALKVFLESFRLTSRAILSGHGIRWEMHNVWLILIDYDYIMYTYISIYILFYFNSTYDFMKSFDCHFAHFGKNKAPFPPPVAAGLARGPPQFWTATNFVTTARVPDVCWRSYRIR